MTRIFAQPELCTSCRAREPICIYHHEKFVKKGDYAGKILRIDLSHKKSK